MTAVPITAPKTEPDRQRFVLVDALRGIAAFAVLCHHLFHNSQLERPLWKILPAWFAGFCHCGAFGVEIFFVLSGFVIAHSVRNLHLSRQEIGSFLLRRQLRLDPPYWTVLLITVILVYVEMRVPWIERRALPDFTDVLKSMFYLQNIAGGLPIVGVAWTLCLEVQFYLVFILLLVVGKWLGGRRFSAENVSMLLVMGLGLVSVLLPKLVLPAWFLQWWFYFAAGVVCYWSVRDRKYRFHCLAFLALAGLGLFTKDPLPLLVGASTALLLYVAGSMGGLTTWLNFRVLQYLGKISYSLYLIHLTVAVYVLRLGYRLTGQSPWGALLWFMVAMAVSIAAGHLFYVLVERRSMQFASRFKSRRAVTAEAPEAASNILILPCPSATANGAWANESGKLGIR